MTMTDMEVTIDNAVDGIMFQRVYSNSGRFAYSAPIGGEFGICLKTNTSAWYNGLRFVLDIAIYTGAEANDYQDIASKEHLDTLQISARKLNDRAQGIRNEMSYQKLREED